MIKIFRKLFKIHNPSDDAEYMNIEEGTITFKEFSDWCNKRASDGCWGALDAMVCIDILNTVNKEPRNRREEIWKRDFEKQVIDEIIIPIENKIKEVYK